MKKVKKLLSVLFALVMVFTLNVPVFAAGNGDNQQDSDDTATISVTNVEANATVTAYQIVKPVYNSNGLNEYVAVLQKNDANGDPMTDDDGNPVMIPEDVANPTEEEIEQLQSRISELTAITMSASATDPNTYSATVGAGSYLVLVTGTSDKTYNPIIVSASYAENATDLSNGTVDSTSNATLNGSQAYAKSSDTTIDKDILKKDANGNIVASDGTIVIDANGNVVNESLLPEEAKGDDTEVGKTVTYQITGEIPSFTEQYTDPVYTITDTPDAALSLPTSVTVKVGGTVVPATTTNDDGTTTVNYTFTPNDTDHNFTVAFSADYITSLRNKSASERKVVITFDSTLDKTKANVNFDPNNNTAKVTWGNDTDDTQDSTEVTTHTYTFGLDMDINGSDSKDTHEITKTGDKITGTTTTTGPLEGAKFELRDGTTVIDSGSTDAGGHVGLKGMDANKEYTLVETQAPAGYTTDSTEYTVKVVNPTYDSTGKLTAYSVEVYKGTGTTKTLLTTFSYTIDADGNVTGIDDGQNQLTYEKDKGDDAGDPDNVIDDGSVFINNTQIPGLPSTGGIGTYIFTIAGGALIAIAIALLIVNKRKKA